MNALIQQWRKNPSRLAWVANRGGLAAVLFLGAIVSVLAKPTNGPASSLSDEKLVSIQFEQKLNSQVNRELRFRDEHGDDVRLGDYFNNKPVILNLGYYGCPMLCTLVLNGMVESLQDLNLDMGRDFEVISVSIDPGENPALAAAKKRTYLKRYGRSGAEEGWHFLTGNQAEIDELAADVGFRYAYDASIDQYAHPSGLVILTPDGRVSRYLFGIDFSARDMNVALRDAGTRKVGSPIDQLVLLCFHYSPLTGEYGDLIMMIVRVSGVVTLLVLAGLLVIRSRRKPGRARRGRGRP